MSAVEPLDAPYVQSERRSAALDTRELRALFKLESELGDLPRGSEQQHRHAIQGLCALVGAQVGIWARVGDLARTGGVVVDAVHLGWSGDRERQVYEDFLAHGQRDEPDPAILEIKRRVTPPVTTMLRQELMSDREWYRSPHVMECRRSGDVDAFIYSVRLTRDGAQVLAIHRPWGDRPFTERERDLVDLFYRESRALAPPLRELPPHIERTLRVLLRGLSEKQVAAELGLSPHTVHDYVRAIYRHFGVGSRAELFARLTGHGK